MFIFRYLSPSAYPGQATPYYMRMRFFIQVQETDEYGFSMFSEHRAELYVSTDDTPDNLVSCGYPDNLVSCGSD